MNCGHCGNPWPCGTVDGDDRHAVQLREAPDPEVHIQLEGMLLLLGLQMAAAVQAGATEAQLLAAVAVACFDDHGKPVRP